MYGRAVARITLRSGKGGPFYDKCTNRLYLIGWIKGISGNALLKFGAVDVGKYPNLPADHSQMILHVSDLAFLW